MSRPSSPGTLTPSSRFSPAHATACGVSPSRHGSALQPKVGRQLRRRYAPLETVSLAEAEQTNASAQRVECPQCQKSYVGAATVNGEPQYDQQKRIFKMTRWAYCDHCNHLIAWDQATDSEGKHLGEVFASSLTIIDAPPAVENFLKRHPELKGVEQ